MMRGDMAPKVKAVYQAVAQLIQEGADLNSLTVSEITGKAGIGKGTVYEYFPDKEEMIAGAIYYTLENSCHRLYDQIIRADGLYEKMNILLTSMEENIADINFFLRGLHGMLDNSVIGCRLRRMVKEKKEDEILLLGLIRQMLEEEPGYRETVSETRRDYLVMDVFSRIICYAMYQLDKEHRAEMDHSAMRQMICRGVCRSMENGAL